MPEVASRPDTERDASPAADGLLPFQRGVRAFCVLAGGVLLATIPLDQVRFPHLALRLLPIRLAGAAVFAALYGAALTVPGRRRPHALGLLAAIAGAAEVTIIAFATGGEGSPVNVSMLFVLLGSGVLIPWEVGWSVLACAAVLAVYAASALLVEGTAVGGPFFDYLLVLLAASGLSVGTSVVRSRRRRRELVHDRELGAALRALAESEARLKMVIANAPVVLFVLDRAGVITLSEGRGLARIGLTPGELAGSPFLEVVKNLRGGGPEDEENLGRALAGEAVTWSTAVLGATFECRLAPICDAHGAVTSVIGLALDVTERQEAEGARLRLERQLLEAQRIESLGVMAAGVAHDFNNLLVSVAGNIWLALEGLPADSPAREILGRAETAARRGSELTRQMLTLSGRGDGAIERIDLNGIVDEMRELLEVSIGRRVATSYALRPDLPPVSADATQVRQIVMNLVLNASEGMGDEGGTITVRTDVVTLGEAELGSTRHGPDASAGPHVCLEVRDTGCGMDAATAARIFDPFFTTKPTGRGLGLATVLGVVRRHRGALTVESEPGRGTTFRVFLPCGGPPAAVAAVEEGADARTVLLVDDEDEVRAVTAHMLERLGCTVLLAGDGQEGLDVFRAHAGVIDAVLLDLTLPRLSGERAFEEMRSIRPDAKVILMSGYSSEESARRVKEIGSAGFLQKPFTVGDLRERLGEDGVRRVSGASCSRPRG